MNNYIPVLYNLLRREQERAVGPQFTLFATLAVCYDWTLSLDKYSNFIVIF